MHGRKDGSTASAEALGAEGCDDRLMDDDFPPGRWRARWIWSEPTPLQFEGATTSLDRDRARTEALLRRTFVLDKVPASVPARCTADSRYALWVNGLEVTRGPVRGHWMRMHVDHFDLAPYLRVGANVIAVQARHYAKANPWWMPAVPTFGLGAGAFAFEARIGDEWIVSDATWVVHTSEAWNEATARGISAQPPEVVDASLLPSGWREPDFDDTAWSAAVELSTNHVGWPGHHHPPSAPYGALQASPLPPLGGRILTGTPIARAEVGARTDLDDDPVLRAAADEESIDGWQDARLAWPLTISPQAGQAETILIDLGEETAGHLGLEIEAPAGAQVDARVAEALGAGGKLAPLDQHNGFRYVARGTHDRFETFDRIGTRYLQISVRSDEPVTLRSVTCRERLRPRPAGASFNSSDPALDRIWSIGNRTVDLCAQDAYLDCPSREQRAWTGDAVVHQMVDLTTNPDWTLALWSLTVGASPRPDGMLPMSAGGDMEWRNGDFIPDWALHWIHALHNAWRYVGDPDALAELLPIAEGVLRWFLPYRGPDGLLHDVTGWVIVDWSAVSVAGTSGALNALWARALREFADISSWIGDSHRASWARDCHEGVAAGFELFWDDERGLYADHALGGVPQLPVSQHTNAAAVAAGVVPDQRGVGVMQRTCDRERLVHAAWLAPGKQATLDGEGNMYAGFDYLVAGAPEPWWDLASQVVAAQPFFRYVVHDAVAAVGLTDRIPDLCRDWTSLLDDDTTTWRETWFGGSYCHGWSSTPTRDLVQYTLGVTPAEPGFGSVRVAPSLGDLRHAAGDVPTPAGFLHVEVDRSSLRLDTPLPATVELDGKMLDLPVGSHQLRRS